MGWPDLAAAAHDASLSAFGESVTLRLAGQPEVTVQGIFTARYQPVTAPQNLSVSSSSPAVGVRDADLPAAPERGDQVDLRGTTYQVHDIHPDGEGWSRLLLHLLT